MKKIMTTDLSVFCLIYQNYMKGVCINKSMNILNQFYQNFDALSDKDQWTTLPFNDCRKNEKHLKQQRSFCCDSH